MIRHYRLLVLSLALILNACAPASTASVPPTQAGSASSVTPAPSAAKTPLHLKVGILNYLSYSPLFIAQDSGYFAEQGLDVEFVDFGVNDANIIPALAQSQIDVGAVSLSAGLFNAIAQGADVRLVADKGFADPNACPSFAWLASKKLLDSGGLKDLAGLKGKSVVASTGNTLEWALDLLLQKAGLTRADVKILNVIDSAARLQGLGNGSIDVTVHSEPWIARARAMGVGDVWIPFSDLMPNASVSGIFYGPTLLDKNPDAGVRFMAAYLKAVKQFSQGKTDTNVAIVAKYTKLPADEIKASCWSAIQPDGKIVTQGLLDFQQWAVQKGYVPKALELSQVWDPQFVDQAAALTH